MEFIFSFRLLVLLFRAAQLADNFSLRPRINEACST